MKMIATTSLVLFMSVMIWAMIGFQVGDTFFPQKSITIALLTACIGVVIPVSISVGVRLGFRLKEIDEMEASEVCDKN